MSIDYANVESVSLKRLRTMPVFYDVICIQYSEMNYTRVTSPAQSSEKNLNWFPFHTAVHETVQLVPVSDKFHPELPFLLQTHLLSNIHRLQNNPMVDWSLKFN